MGLDMEMLATWIGRREVVTDTVAASPVAGLAATLDRDDPAPRPDDMLPPGWHWLFCLPCARQGALGPDGHPARGGFLPPVPLPRRMWAAGRMTFHAPLRIGGAVRRESTIADVTLKQGRQGPLVFVLVRHEISGPDGLALVEEQDIVYRDEAGAGGTPDVAADGPAMPAPSWRRVITPDPVLLFRFSALTFNGHRIHYDRPYATTTEGYPGLVVHGPLLAVLMLDLLRRERPDATLARFAFRLRRPLFDTAPFTLCGAPRGEAEVDLWVEAPDGAVAATATVETAT